MGGGHPPTLLLRADGTVSYVHTPATLLTSFGDGLDDDAAILALSVPASASHA